MKTMRCENCGRPILMSDAQCFHCGSPVPGRQVTPVVEDENTADWRSSLRLGSVVITLMIMGLVLTNWMGESFNGSLAALEGARGPDGWQEYIPPDQTYQIWLPGNWQIETPQGRGWQELVGAIPEPLPNSFRQIAPARMVDRANLVASSKTAQDRQPITVSVQLHPGLVHYSLISLQVDDWSDGGVPIDTVNKTELFVRDNGDSALLADLIYPREGGTKVVRTLVMLIRSADGIYALTAAADPADFERNEETMRQIFDHFELLDILRGLDAF
jgi:hypothetical protein